MNEKQLIDWLLKQLEHSPIAGIFKQLADRCAEKRVQLTREQKFKEADRISDYGSYFEVLADLCNQTEIRYAY